MLNLQTVQCSGISAISLWRNASLASLRNAHIFSQSDNYEFMQRSKVPTLHFQRSLPRLPIPPLDKTSDRFISAVQPILSTQEFDEARSAVTAFRAGVGSKLDSFLRQSDLANKHTSYISQPWFDMYLSDRKSLPLNYNPLLVMKNELRPEYKQQIYRATNLVISSLRFWHSLQADLLEPEIYHLNPKKSDTEQFRKWMKIMPELVATYAAYAFKAFPLDMSQYNRLFGVARIPELGKDRIVQYSDSKHIMVMCAGNIYAVDVLDSKGNIETPSVILYRLQCVLHMKAKRGPSKIPLGVLTSAERNEWARIRQHLISKSVNKNLIENEVDSALFCLCLDEADDPIYKESNPTPLFKHLLAGSGRNRWFDKSISLLISADGTAAVNFEHSWGDGVAVLRYFNEIYNETTQRPFVNVNMQLNVDDSINHVRLLEFDIDEQLQNDVMETIAKNENTMKNLNMDMLRYSKLNKNFCKNHRVSADSIMQLSFQLAYKNAFGEYVGSYESCSTAAFRHGRTETMRPCTMTTKKFCDSVLKSSHKPHVKELRALIDECSRVHGNLTKEAAMGQGFDRHLFALKHIACENGISIPDLYKTKAYDKINYNIISTSTLSSDALLAGSFGPVVTDGLGIGYSIQNQECGAIVTSYEHQRNGKIFIEKLEEAFDHIYHILIASKYKE